VYATHYLEEGGMLVLFTGECPPLEDGAAPRRLRGEAMLLPEDGRLRMTGGVAIDDESPIPRDRYTEYESGGISTRTSVYSYVYGNVFSPDVEAVEVLFDNGKVVRSEARGRTYGAVVRGGRGPCEARVIGRGGRVLGETDLALKATAGSGPDVRPGGADAWRGSQARPETCKRLQR
jgi:hypothetical protein